MKTKGTLVIASFCLLGAAFAVQSNDQTMPKGMFLGTFYEGDKPSTKTDFVANAAKAVRLTIGSDKTYKFEQVSTDMVQIEGGKLLIASGTVTEKDGLWILTPSKDGQSALSVLGWNFKKSLTLKVESDKSLSLQGKPNGETDPPRGGSLRFVAIKKTP